VAAGEQVYAVQYRKIRFKWHSSRDLNPATLEKGSRWVVHGGVVRGQVGTNDVLEASVSSGEESEAEEILSDDAESMLCGLLGLDILNTTHVHRLCQQNI
jgi:hypothetical protein